MRIQRIIAVATRFVVDQADRTNTAVASVIACAFHLRHRQMYLGMPPAGGTPFSDGSLRGGLSPLGSERRTEWLGTDKRCLLLATASA
ncbi:hypothetical protein [Roseimaritima ulvae]|uniref:Uncharacterized protein n=1 Tax=Roseimaritima ulvae TaxID=980254 RepID=A0A5B9QY15_9BACT|nr:hypothetical protein [Roseimaritima ulvae]QEG42720.1 hypothetical protein UC8_47620 [Roseimaritima ulvae]